ncbi:MAG: WD40/YVTN/BNR-like repeat-containing protein [Pseudomonadota bacterium]
MGRSGFPRIVILTLLLAHAGAVCAQAWEILGPGPSHNGQVEGITNREVVGAVNAIAAHPTNADIVYIGSVNGGIWRTLNATAAAPAWTRQTDGFESLSIGSIEFDPTDATRQTLVAGVARTSSLARFGGTQPGMLRTTDGGANWVLLAPGGALLNRAVVGIAARGAILVAATDNGVYRSTTTGTAFSLVSGAAGSGLPAGTTPDLAADPAMNARLYVAITSGSARGVYRSTDTGATWAKVSDAAVDAVFDAGASRARLAVGAAGQVFVGVIGSNGRLAEVFRSGDGIGGWIALGVPTTAEQNGVLCGVPPGRQGGIHFSISADPVDANLVYVGGDRQPFFGEGVSGSMQFFPNSIGAIDFSGRLFRGDAAAAAGSRWTSLTHSGAGNASAPHADSRDMAFDAAGNLLEADDGGLYKRVNPRTTTGAWLSLNGDLQVTEYHGLSYDTVSNRVIGGSQDNGTTEQRDTTRIFNAVSTGDGGHPAVEDRASTTLSTRYSSFQNLGSLRRRTVNASNVVQSTTFPARTVVGGGPALSAQFYTPIVINAAVVEADTVNAARLLIGAANGIYESLDAGATIAFLTPVDAPPPVLRVNQFQGAPIVYGVPGNPDYILAGVTENPSTAPVNALRVRTAAGAALAQFATLPSAARDVAVDRDSIVSGAPTRLFVLTAAQVLTTANGAAPLSDITGNLVAGLSPGALRAMVFIPTAAVDALVVGADRGVFIARGPSFDAWSRLGTGLPNAPVQELDYDLSDGVLVAGLLGRGAWIQRDPLGPTPPETLFANGFEP